MVNTKGLKTIQTILRRWSEQGYDVEVDHLVYLRNFRLKDTMDSIWYYFRMVIRTK